MLWVQPGMTAKHLDVAGVFPTARLLLSCRPAGCRHALLPLWPGGGLFRCPICAAHQIQGVSICRLRMLLPVMLPALAMAPLQHTPQPSLPNVCLQKRAFLHLIRLTAGSPHVNRTSTMHAEIGALLMDRQAGGIPDNCD